MAPRQYIIEAVAVTSDQQQQIDSALVRLAAEGIWVTSQQERNTQTGAALTTINTAVRYNQSKAV